MAQQQERPFLQDFVRYVWQSPEPPQVEYYTLAHGTIKGNWPDFKPQWHLQRFPLGKVWVYPEYAAFLSTSRMTPGVLPRGGQLGIKMLENYREMAPVDSLMATAAAVYRQASRDEQERLRRPLANPNTIIVPRRSITGVTRQKVRGPLGYVQWLEVSTAGRTVLLSPPTTIGRESLRATTAMFGKDWEPRLFQMLSAR